MKATITVRRYQPEERDEPYYEDFEVEVDPTDRVLDALNHIKWHVDGTLALRRSCQHGICGSDAMRINGENRLACKTLMEEVGDEVTVEPLMGFEVKKDLVVDFEDFFEQMREVGAYQMTDSEPPDRERVQSPEEHERYEETSKCIMCGACTGSCPSFWPNRDFVGPAAIVQAHRFIFDSRDEGTEERLAELDRRDGVWACRTIFNCTKACPVDIEVTEAIGEVKRAITEGDL
jgi:succinate dehydrogenase / fumarate reductase iron-sulfur subunit